MSSPVLYTFGLSVWAAVPDIAILELGYADGKIEKKIINLAHGENFAPSFVKINPTATLPTLTVGDKAYTNTIDVVDYLVKNAPNKVAARTSLATIIHEDKYDPNFPLLSIRNEEEFNAKTSGFAHTFVANRQKSLEEHAASDEGSEHKSFYENKLAANGGVLAIYQGKVPDAVKEGFFAHSNAHWETIRGFVLKDLPNWLPESGFVGGDIPGEDDFHLAAWIARIASTTGASSDKDGVKVLDKELGEPVPAKVVAYWNAWAARPSWKQVYSTGLH